MSVRRSPALVALTLALLCAGLVAGPTSALAAPSSPTAAAVRTAKSPPPSPTGRPPRNYVIAPGSYFSFPNRSKSDRVAIRNRVIATINSVWGGPKTPSGMARRGNGTIRIATWSFKDMTVAKALVAARKRGVSVQVVAAKSANTDHQPWRWLKKRLGKRLYSPGHPETRELVSFARECRGSCRGRGGTAHSKYFMFDNVGRNHARNIVVQTSMNLTGMGYQGQWNQAYVTANSTIYQQFLTIYRQTRIGQPIAQSYRTFVAGSVTSKFFPLRGGRPSNDPVMEILNRVRCTGSTAGGSGGRTKIRIIQYSIYGERGDWLAKKLRSLWSAGCDVAIIYAVSSRPVVGILQHSSGRGAIPMRQSVVTNDLREIVKYNHSKWMTVVGNWGGASDAFVTFTGSANWSPFAFTGDEQMQQILSRSQALRHNSVFSKTWNQPSSHPPMYGTKAQEARMMARIPEQPTFGKGIYKHLTPYGE